MSISQDGADAIKVGRRGQRAGLLYDMRFTGHDPHLWPHVVLPDASGRGSERTMMLEDELGGSRSMLVTIPRQTHASRPLHTPSLMRT
eukprot:4633813-Prymnesium_polylepis.3